MNNILKLVGAAALSAALSHGTLAADHKVWMKGSCASAAGPDACEGQLMRFEPDFLKIAAGDTVTFSPEDAGHSVERISGPQGTEPFSGNYNQELTVTFTVEGLYAYKCQPHEKMGMVGLIQVGDSTAGVDSAKAADLPDKAKSQMKALLAKAGVAAAN